MWAGPLTITKHAFIMMLMLVRLDDKVVWWINVQWVQGSYQICEQAWLLSSLGTFTQQECTPSSCI